jgi:diadenosine tetraphosphatase ApaH/serine/threonine PP2A family protein phosphatase
MIEQSELNMRYAIFSDIHANLEALEAVLAKIDELAQEQPIDQIWFLGDLVGYGPDPNECIRKLRERTDVIIAGNHDWAAVGKIDLEDFSAAARISAEWTADQLTEEHRAFLTNLPERLENGECTLVHGSPYGPLWEYLTTEVLAERSFQYFNSRYCLVGHTHVPVIFQQPDSFSNAPTLPLQSDEPATVLPQSNGIEYHTNENDDETAEMVAVQQSTLSAKITGSAGSAFKEPESIQTAVEDEANAILEEKLLQTPDEASLVVEDVTKVADKPGSATEDLTSTEQEGTSTTEINIAQEQDAATSEDTISTEEHSSLPTGTPAEEGKPAIATTEVIAVEDRSATVLTQTTVQETDTSTVEVPPIIESGEITTSDSEDATAEETDITQAIVILHDEATTQETDALRDENIAQDTDTPIDAEQTDDDDYMNSDDTEQSDEMTLEPVTAGIEDPLSSEIEELLTLLGLSQSMIQVTNEMITPPEGHWEASHEYRAIINPGGVGQPRDGDPRAAFMIYDTERGFEFYRVPYAFEKTQEKIIKAGLPHYLAVRLAYGR